MNAYEQPNPLDQKGCANIVGGGFLTFQTESALGSAFKLDYSLKFKEITKHTTELGYFHDLSLVVVAINQQEAVKMLRVWHYDGVPEGIKATPLGKCVKRPARHEKPDRYSEEGWAHYPQELEKRLENHV
jgi:hypothetical protein